MPKGSKLFAKLEDNGDGKISSKRDAAAHWAKFGGEMFDRMDTDHDGKVTKAEFQAAGEKMFQRMDKNGDGIIEKDEMSAPHGDQPPGG
jgi:Ca2+-binding EF-hand superfamily protein